MFITMSSMAGGRRVWGQAGQDSRRDHDSSAWGRRPKSRMPAGVHEEGKKTGSTCLDHHLGVETVEGGVCAVRKRAHAVSVLPLGRHARQLCGGDTGSRVRHGSYDPRWWNGPWGGPMCSISTCTCPASPAGATGLNWLTGHSELRRPIQPHGGRQVTRLPSPALHCIQIR